MTTESRGRPADLRGGRRAVGVAPLVGRVVVGRRRLELGGAGVDRLVGAGEALGAVAFGGERLQLAQEPAVDQAEARAPPRPRGRAGSASSTWSKRSAVGIAERRDQLGVVGGEFGGRVELARAHRLGEGLAEGAPDRHRLADRLHVGREPAVGAGELLEGEARDLGDDIVDRRLEGGRRRLGDVVGDLLQGVADRQFRRHLRDRETGCLGGERRGAADPRVHLDHATAPVSGSTPNCTLEPPVSTPIARITLIAMSRSSW